MKIKLWGTRGSLPRTLSNNQFVELVSKLSVEAETSGCKTIEDFRKWMAKPGEAQPRFFGGNTTCYEVVAGTSSCYVDMGTGITDAGISALNQNKNQFSIFLTHMHWDHIMGLPFFVPIYIPGTKITIYHVHKNAPEYVRIQFNGINFPVKWDAIGAEVEFVELKLYEPVTFGKMTVTPFCLDHPGGSFGYRFEHLRDSIAIGVDSEFKRTSPKALGKDLPFYQNLTALVFDAQYEMNELASRYDWGHCSPPIGVDLALREGIRNLILTHHDPRSDEDRSHRMLKAAENYLQSSLPEYEKIWKELNQAQGPNIISAYDGLEIDISSL